MNEQEIKEKLLDESKDYEIKTKSSDIIKAFKMKEFKKIPFYRSKVFITSVSSLALFTLISVPTYLLLSKEDTPIINNKEKVLNMMSYEALAGLSYLENDVSSPSKMVRKFKNSDFDREEFEDVCDVFYSYVPLVSNLNSFDNYIEIDSIDEDYPYGVKIGEYLIFYKVIDNSKIEGKIHIDEEILDIKVDIENEEDEVETKCVIFKDSNNYVEIERETELNENEFSLKHVIDSKIYEEINFEIEDDKKQLKISTYNYLELDYEYKIESIDKKKITFDADAEETYEGVNYFIESKEFQIVIDFETIIYKKVQ